MEKSDAERLADKLDSHPYDIGGSVNSDLMTDVRIAAAMLRDQEKELARLRPRDAMIEILGNARTIHESCLETYRNTTAVDNDDYDSGISCANVEAMRIIDCVRKVLDVCPKCGGPFATAEDDGCTAISWLCPEKPSGLRLVGQFIAFLGSARRRRNEM